MECCNGGCIFVRHCHIWRKWTIFLSVWTLMKTHLMEKSPTYRDFTSATGSEPGMKVLWDRSVWGEMCICFISNLHPAINSTCITIMATPISYHWSVNTLKQLKQSGFRVLLCGYNNYERFIIKIGLIIFCMGLTHWNDLHWQLLLDKTLKFSNASFCKY